MHAADAQKPHEFFHILALLLVRFSYSRYAGPLKPNEKGHENLLFCCSLSLSFWSPPQAKRVFRLLSDTPILLYVHYGIRTHAEWVGPSQQIIASLARSPDSAFLQRRFCEPTADFVINDRWIIGWDGEKSLGRLIQIFECFPNPVILRVRRVGGEKEAKISYFFFLPGHS